MDIQVKKLSLKEYTAVVSGLKLNIPLWLEPNLIGCYKHLIILQALEGEEIKGLWVVPVIIKGKNTIAKREYRFFPFSSPLILDNDNLKRRKITNRLFKKLTSICSEVNLPFDPSFKDFPTIQGLGGYVEWRHTHRLSHNLNFNKITHRLRNHIKSARLKIGITISSNPDDFKFDMAIKGDKEEIESRKKLALKLLKNNMAVIVSARTKQLCAGILIVYDNDCAYLLHSWQHENTPRGTISAIIYEGINWVFSKTKIRFFDFEGSIIQSIDYFFCGFNADIIPYGFLFWSKKQQDLLELIKKSINIRGRMVNDY